MKSATTHSATHSTQRAAGLSSAATRPSGTTSTAVVVVLAGVLAAAAGCMKSFDPATARSEFSSKERSMKNGPTERLARGSIVGSPAEDPGYRADARSREADLSSSTSTSASASASSSSSSSEPIVYSEVSFDALPAARLDAAPSLSERSAAADVLRAAARSNWAALRANALEAAASNPALLAELAPRGLVDENRGVRFVACMSIARAEDRELSLLVRPLLQDDSASVRAAAMLALARTGNTVDFSPLAAMLGENDAEVRGNAYLVLGELGNRSAVPLIRESLGRGMRLVNPVRARLVDLTAAEALVKLGDEREIEPIRAALFAPPEQAELTVVACEAIGRLRDEVSRPMLERLVSVGGDAQRSPEIRLAAAKALVSLGGAAPMALSIAREAMTSPDARVRSQAAGVLGALRVPEAYDLLAALIRDADPTVQVAAAAGIESAE
jgi:HEAT repeat protein